VRRIECNKPSRMLMHPRRYEHRTKSRPNANAMMLKPFLFKIKSQMKCLSLSHPLTTPDDEPDEPLVAVTAGVPPIFLAWASSA
jgi:hypothetical protein